MKIKLDEGAFMPVRAHAQDAGLDIKSPVDFMIEGFNSITIDTGVHVQLPEGTVGLLKSKSGLNVKHNITSEGVIDEGYTGSIRVKLYNNGRSRYCGCMGDKISQLVVVPVMRVDVVQVDELEESERGANGFGSTGR